MNLSFFILKLLASTFSKKLKNFLEENTCAFLKFSRKISVVKI
jgi:hypothetical protein